MNKNGLLLGLSSFLTLLILCSTELETHAQDPTIRYGTGVPPAVRSINDRSLRYLANTQLEDGSWPGGQNGAGITGICVMAFMASGEDPDYGPYATHIRKALRNMIINQNPKTGYMTGVRPRVNVPSRFCDVSTLRGVWRSKRRTPLERE